MTKRSKMTDAQVLIQLARESLERYGTALPPTAAAPRPKAKGKKINAAWKTTETTCSKCGKVGMVDPDFGVRIARGIERKQSWCRECRATTNYYHLPRKNRTMNSD